MSILDLVFLCILVFFIGFYVTFLICYSRIALKPRTWLVSKSKFFAELLGCPFCTGTWVGLLVSVPASYLLFPTWTLADFLVRILVGVSATATSAYLLDLVAQTLEKAASRDD
jgi:hypothetical protein